MKMKEKTKSVLVLTYSITICSMFYIGCSLTLLPYILGLLNILGLIYRGYSLTQLPLKM